MVFKEEQKLLDTIFKEMGAFKLRYRLKCDFRKRKVLFLLVNLETNVVKYQLINSKKENEEETIEFNCFSSAIYEYNKII